MRGTVYASLAILLAASLAGCADADEGKDLMIDPEIQARAAPGTIVGIVVDDAVRPLEGATVTLTAQEPRSTTTDADGSFIFQEVDEGSHFLRISKLNHEDAQVSVEVQAGQTTPVVRAQLARLFSQEPFTDQLKFQGFIACSYHAVLITAPCVTDYTQILVPGGAAPILREAQGDQRTYEHAIDGGWQQQVIEMTWDPSAQGTSDEMAFTVSHAERLASHWFAQADGPDPVRLQIDVGIPHSSGQGDPNMIPPEGIPDLVVFMNVGSGGEEAAVAVQQEFEMFHHTFYHGLAPEDWSFVLGDPLPF